VIKNTLNKKKTSFIIFIKPTIILILIFFTIFVFYEIYQSNLIKKKTINFVEKYSQDYNYTLKNIEINKLINIKRLDIEKYFNNYNNKSIFLVPIKQILTKLKKNKWIDSVEIKNDYKNTISIMIIESKPIGIFFNGIKYQLFDKNGKIIDIINSENNTFYYLIKFTGKKSIFHANLLLESTPFLIKDEIEEAIFVNTRRWDIKLKNGIYLKLAEKNLSYSFENYATIYENLSNTELQKIESIDLRLPKKAVIKFKKI